MREKNFIAQKKDKWKELEELLDQKKKDPDKLSNLFVQVTDDLSFAQTFYPNRFVRLYLNAIAQRLFYTLYGNKNTKKNRFTFFWKEELPRLIYSARKELLFSLIFFIISFCIGVISSAYDPEFPSVILGNKYVEMTMENIQKGDPMAVYKKMNEFDMFMGITINNLYVSFLTFISGVVYCLGSIGLLMYNGIMVGVFQYFFYKQHLLITSSLTIWLHGTLEISSIIIASGAGITMGRGLLFPGTYSRFQSFFISARRGIKILIGIVPIIITAAIIESFLTRYTDAPIFVKGGLILLSLGFILIYFVWYPIKKHKSVSTAETEESGLHASKENVFDFSAIHSNGTIFGEIFSLYKSDGRRILKRSILLSILAAAAIYFLQIKYFYSSGGTVNIKMLFDYSNNIHNAAYFILNTFIFSFMIFFLMNMLSKKANPEFKSRLPEYIKVIFFSAFLNVFFFMNGWLTFLFMIIFGPFFIQWFSVSFYEKQDLISSIWRGFSRLDADLMKSWMFFQVTLLFGIFYFFLIDSPLLKLYTQILKWNFSINDETLQKINIFLALFTPYFTILLILPTLLFGNFLQYFTLTEISEAKGLNKKIQTLKNPKS